MNNDNFMPMFEIEALAGARGQKGERGDQGPQGERGFTGPQGEQGIPGVQGVKGDTGPAGNGVASVTQTTVSTEDEGVNVWTLTETNGTTDTFQVRNGSKGSTGLTGNGISSIAKTSSSGLTDTYTITYTSGGTTTYTLENGRGISNITKTASAGVVDTYTITYNDNTTSTYQVTNGATTVILDITNELIQAMSNFYEYGNGYIQISNQELESRLNEIPSRLFNGDVDIILYCSGFPDGDSISNCPQYYNIINKNNSYGTVNLNFGAVYTGDYGEAIWISGYENDIQQMVWSLEYNSFTIENTKNKETVIAPAADTPADAYPTSRAVWNFVQDQFNTTYWYGYDQSKRQILVHQAGYSRKEWVDDYTNANGVSY